MFPRKEKAAPMVKSTPCMWLWAIPGAIPPKWIESLDGLMGKSSKMGVLFNTHDGSGWCCYIWCAMDPINIPQSC